jgi:hypothetical protein
MIRSVAASNNRESPSSLRSPFIRLSGIALASVPAFDGVRKTEVPGSGRYAVRPCSSGITQSGFSPRITRWQLSKPLRNLVY